MYVTALVEFDDIRAGVHRNKGDEFVVSRARFDEINAVGMSKIGEPIVEESPKEDAKPKAKRSTRKAK